MEYHLYLYRPALFDIIATMLLTVDEVDNAIDKKQDIINTIQVCTLSTSLLSKGYRIFVHYKKEDEQKQFEITLGECEHTTREIRAGHDLAKLLLAGEFDLT